MADNYQRPNYRWIGRAAMVLPNIDIGDHFELYECSMCGALVREPSEAHSDLHTDIQELMSSVLQLQSAASGHAHRLPDHIHEYSGSVTSEEMA